MSAVKPIEKELLNEFAQRLSASLEAMTGEAPAISWDPLPAAPETEPTALSWRQPLSGLPGAIWLYASEQAWTSAGQMVLAGAGIPDADSAEIRSTYLEVSNQALAGLAQALTKLLQREVNPANGGETSDPLPGAARWAEFSVQLGAASLVLTLGLENALIAALPDPGAKPDPAKPATVASAASSAPPPVAMAAGAGAGGGNAPPASNPLQGSKTFDLLLDVELPVSISFGRAQIQLKDVLKLTTGAIVELNRSIAEPVEIIVNNCVIARGEVVVIEGNFGVRIQEVISRQERLRTLQ